MVGGAADGDDEDRAGAAEQGGRRRRCQDEQRGVHRREEGGRGEEGRGEEVERSIEPSPCPRVHERRAEMELASALFSRAALRSAGRVTALLQREAPIVGRGWFHRARCRSGGRHVVLARVADRG
eukprot:1719095-Pyramimonas_sp.AAC.1